MHTSYRWKVWGQIEHLERTGYICSPSIFICCLFCCLFFRCHASFSYKRSIIPFLSYPPLSLLPYLLPNSKHFYSIPIVQKILHTFFFPQIKQSIAIYKYKTTFKLISSFASVGIAYSPVATQPPYLFLYAHTRRRDKTFSVRSIRLYESDLYPHCPAIEKVVRH